MGLFLTILLVILNYVKIIFRPKDHLPIVKFEMNDSYSFYICNSSLNVSDTRVADDLA